MQTVIVRKTAAGGESQVSLSFSGSTAIAAVATVYRGVDPSSPIDAESTGTAKGSATVTAASVTTSLASERLVMFEGELGTTSPPTWTAPSGMTDEVHVTNLSTASAAAADQTPAAAGATGSRTATLSKTANLTAALVALKPQTWTYAYDARGNRTGITTLGATTTLTYDQESRLTGFGASATYTYNGDGLRMSKTVSGTTTAFT